MKKYKLIILTLALLVFVPKIVFAENSYVAEVNGEKYLTIESAMTAAEGTNNKVKLLDDVTLLETKLVEKDLTIDLNGFNITKTNKLFEVRGATFTLTGKGTLEETTPDYAPILVYGAEEDIPNYTIVNVGKDVILKGWSGIMVRQLSAFSAKSFSDNTAYGIVVNFDGKAESFKDSANVTGSGIYVNGAVKNSGNIPIINIGNTVEINSLGNAIYAAGNAKWNIDGAKLTAVEAAIAIKAGIFNIKNSLITGTDEDKTPVEGYGNGIKASGAAIQIESNSDYYGKIEINISNSKLVSKKGVAYYEYIATNSKIPTTDTKVKSVKITDCEYDSRTDRPNIVTSLPYVEKFTKNIVVEKMINGILTTDKTTALVGELVTISTIINDGYELKNITLNGEVKTLKDNTFNMLNTDVKVSGNTIKIETTTELPVVNEKTEVKEVIIGVKNTEEIQNVLLESFNKNEELVNMAEDKAIKIEVEIDKIDATKLDEKKVESIKKKAGNATITNFFDISVAVKETVSNNKITNLTELTKEIELMVLLPDELKNNNNKIDRKYYIVREHNDEVELLNATISEDGKYLVFKTNKFSTYALAYEDNIKTSPKTGDNVLFTILFGGMSMIGIVGTTYYIKKKKLFN